MDFTEKMLRAIDAELARAMPEPHARWSAERPFTFDEPFARVPMNDAVGSAAKTTEIAAWAEAVAKDGGVMGLVALLAAWATSAPA